MSETLNEETDERREMKASSQLPEPWWLEGLKRSMIDWIRDEYGDDDDE